jgi:ATP-dependent 26S proteasome regulatory subunit
MAKDDLSGADIKAVCMEAGMLALRERRMRVTQVSLVYLLLLDIIASVPFNHVAL